MNSDVWRGHDEIVAHLAPEMRRMVEDIPAEALDTIGALETPRYHVRSALDEDVFDGH